MKGLDALAAAGLLKSLEDRDIHVKRYELTTYGKRVPPRFCYGHRVVTSIDGFTPPAVVNGQQTTQVSYHYKMMDVPGWADSDSDAQGLPRIREGNFSRRAGPCHVSADRRTAGVCRSRTPGHRLN